MAKGESKMCKCVDQVNEQLAASNVKIGQGLQINFKTGQSSMSPPQIVLEKINAKVRKRMPTVLCSFCPFCGKKFPE